MGLDLLEFALSVEEAFQLRFPDEDLVGITTPRRLIDYLAVRLPVATTGFCLSRRAFYLLRTSFASRIGCPHSALRPDASLLALIPAADRSAVWEGVRREIGAAGSEHWPRLADRR